MSFSLSQGPAPGAQLESCAGRGVGVVLVHGKSGSPRRHVVVLGQALERAGFLVDIPEMPWSHRRGFDRSYGEALAEIDAAASRLESRGAGCVAVAGHSLGGNAAMGYAAHRPGLKAVVALAPGHTPELLGGLLADSLARARGMVAEGRGQEQGEFFGTFQGRTVPMPMRAADYLSYYDPAGPAVMPGIAEAWPTPAPLLWVVGDRDPLTSLGPEYAFAKTPVHPQSRYLTVSADHFTTPDVAAEMVVQWFLGLGPCGAR